MFRFFLRTFGWMLFRFALLIATVIFLQSFEVTPFPAWTLTAFVFLLQFLITYAATWFALGQRLPGRKEHVILIACFLGGEVLLEAILLRFIRGSWNDLRGAYTIWLFVPLVWHLSAMVVALYRKKRRILQTHAPEGVRV